MYIYMYIHIYVYANGRVMRIEIVRADRNFGGLWGFEFSHAYLS